MGALSLKLDVKPYKKQVLCDEVRAASGASPQARDATQVKYLGEFLAYKACDAQTILIEKPYVDRHYLEEYSRYYATSRMAPSPHATRLHFFAKKWSKKELCELLGSAADGEDRYCESKEQLQASYLGFCVVRPIPSAPIGRTVIRPYTDLSARVLLTSHAHHLHLCGVELTVHGVPFQQQETAVGACATTALWSALAIAARRTGRRPPTPFEVTDAATRHVLNDRPFPADSGLDLPQALGAVRAHGFAPYTLSPGATPHVFSIAVKSYLRSGFPVVLLLRDTNGYHAVTAVGYREPDETSPASFVYTEGNRRLETPSMARVYVHEDRLGPYARMEWHVVDPKLDLQLDPQVSDAEQMQTLHRSEGGVWLQHLPYEQARYDYPSDRMQVYAAIVPLYPKLRLSALGLLKSAGDLVPMLSRWLNQAPASAKVELFFRLSGDYLRDVMRLGIQPAGRAGRLTTRAVLPRYVGVARFYDEGRAFLDAVFDTTDVLRHEPSYSRLIALLALVEPYSESVKHFVSTEVPHGIAE